MRATTAHAPQREATKAAFVRALYPARRGLAELARRSRLEHDDFFLLTIDEVADLMRGRGPSDDVIAERRDRRDELNGAFRRSGSRVHCQHLTRGPCAMKGRNPTLRLARSSAWVCARASPPARRASSCVRTSPAVWVPATSSSRRSPTLRGRRSSSRPPVSWSTSARQQSHAAIVSRELGIPAVVSATGASATIPDGTWVTVDGTRWAS